MLLTRDNQYPMTPNILSLYNEGRLLFKNEADTSLSFFNIIFLNIKVPVIFEMRQDASFNILYNDVFLLTLILFMKNEIIIENVLFSELSRPIQRKFEQYYLYMLFIEPSQNQEEIDSLIKNLKELR